MHFLSTKGTIPIAIGGERREGARDLSVELSLYSIRSMKLIFSKCGVGSKPTVHRIPDFSFQYFTMVAAEIKRTPEL